MAFGKVETPKPERKPFNIDDVETSSNQQNIVTPYIAGVVKCPVDWVTGLQSLRSQTVSQGGGGKGGKGGGSSANEQKNWYANIAGVTNVCMDDAPNDAILAILVNGEVALGSTDPLNPTPISRSPGTHYVAFSVPKYSQACRFYWGTKDQPIDDLVLAGITNEKHPAYRNQGLFVAQQWFLGTSPNLQSIVIILARGTKFFASRFEAGATGVNPAGPVYELLVDDLFGMGITESTLVESKFTDTATAMTAENMALAPALRQAVEARSFFPGYFEYFDGFFRRNGAQLELGYFPHGDIDVDALPALGSSDIVGKADVKPGTLRNTKNSFWVTYSNRAKWYKDDDTDRYISQENFLKTGLLLDERLERPFIIDGDIAVRHALGWGKLMSLEPVTGEVQARRDRTTLQPGDRFKTNIDSLSLSFVWRVISRETPSDRDGAYKFTLENERGIYPAHFVPPPAPGPPGFVIEPAAIEHAKIVELPGGLRSENAIQIAILMQRPNTHIIGAKIHLSPDNIIYEQLYTQLHFCAFGTVAVAYPLTTDIDDTTVGLQVDLSGEDQGILGSQSPGQQQNNTLLVFFGREIASVGTVQALGGNRYKIFLRRARYGTARMNHAVSEQVYIIPRLSIEPIEHASFAAHATLYFKLQPFTYGGDYDIDLVAPIAYYFNDGPFLLANLELYGQGENTEFVGRNPRFRWDLFDISGLGVISTSPPAVFNSGDGLWYDLIADGAGDDVFVRAARTGHSSAPLTGAPSVFNSTTGLWYAMTAVGVGDTMYVHLASTGSSTAPPGGAPIVYNRETDSYYRLSAAGTGTDIYVQLTFLFTGDNPVANPFNASGPPDQFVRFDLRVRNPADDTVVWQGQSVVNDHIFSEEENALAIGGPFRRFPFDVSAVARLQDGSLTSTPWLTLDDVHNQQSVALGGSITARYDRIDINLIRPLDLDYAGQIWWRSLDPFFGIASPLDAGVEMVHDGPDSSFSILQPEGTTYYYRSAAYDVFSPSDHSSAAFLADIDIGAPIPLTTLTLTPTLPPPAISPSSQNFTSTLDISIMVPDGATARYTLDGTEVSPVSQEWPKAGGVYIALSISQSCTLRARYYDASGTPSQDVIATYTLEGSGSTCGNVPIHFSGVRGVTSGNISLSCATPASTIHYSLNGAEYVNYTGPFAIAVGDIVEAYASAPGLADGPHSYFNNSGGIPP